jgi:phosphatidylserine/phosphatidylglycerophosphate/cardiolipin synthase-like enzyme
VSLLNAKRAGGMTVEVFSGRYLGDVKSHGKIMLVDDKTVMVGSLALAALSLDFRREVAIVVTEPAAVASAVDLFKTVRSASQGRTASAGTAGEVLC